VLCLPDLQLLIGVPLLLFGTRWLAKAVARHAGRMRLRDEATEFAETQVALSRGGHTAARLVAFKDVLLEGLEVWMVVVALGSQANA
jgi:Ca2+/H+ antiporter, TMEM165/GDT1 family